MGCLRLAMDLSDSLVGRLNEALEGLAGLRHALLGE
jgi:hypothetical protein